MSMKFKQSVFWVIVFMLAFAGIDNPLDAQEKGCIGKQKKQPKAFIDNKKNYVFYKGIDNHISVSVPGYCHDQVLPIITRGMVTYKDNGNYVVRVPDASSTQLDVTIKIENGELKTIRTQQYRISKLPLPQPHIRGHKFGKIRCNVMTSASQLEFRVPRGSPVTDTTFQLAHYQWTFIPQNGPTLKRTEDQASWGSKLINTLKGATEGDRFIIRKILLRGPEGERSLDNGIYLKVTD